MKKFIALVLFALIMVGCSKVPAGNVGVKVYLLGGSKGVESEELGVGRYWIGWNEELYLFPTFTQNVVWTKNESEGSPTDESITFQTTEGMSVNADVGISYRIEKTKVNTIFQKYRKGINEITDVYLRNMVRDAFTQAGSIRPVEAVYGKGKTKLLKDVQDIVEEQVKDIGIVVEKIYLVGSLRLPKTVINALNRKIEATQRAEQRENELREAEAQAKKVVAEAKGKAESVLLKADAQAKANIKLAKSISKELIQYEAIKKWDGILPKMTGAENAIPMISLMEK